MLEGAHVSLPRVKEWFILIVFDLVWQFMFPDHALI